MPRPRRSNRWSVIVTIIVATALPFMQPSSASAQQETVDAIVRQLRRAVQRQQDNSHLLLLSSLRQLHDPAMRPLLLKLVHHEDWQVQVHAVLGLADIAEDRLIDPWLVTQVDPAAQEALVTHALDKDLLTVQQMAELARWDDVSSIVRLLLWAELQLRKQAVDDAELQKMARRPNLKVAGLASCLLAQQGDASILSAFSDRVHSLPDQNRRRHLSGLLEMAGRFELTAMIPWIVDLIENPETDDSLLPRAVFTLLQLDVERGLQQWQALLGSTPSHAEQIRYGMLLLASDAPAPPDTFDSLTSDDPLARAIVEAGRSRATPTDAIIQLLDLGHVRSAEWAMEHTRSLPRAQAQPIYEHLISNASDDGGGRAERVDLAVMATSNLFDLDPARTIELLLAAEDDGIQQQAILLGLFETTSPLAGQAAGRVRRIGSGQADSLALLLMARHVEDLSEDDRRQLGLIARGGGRVSAVLQIQACWLYLTHTGQAANVVATLTEEAG